MIGSENTKLIRTLMSEMQSKGYVKFTWPWGWKNRKEGVFGVEIYKQLDELPFVEQDRYRTIYDLIVSGDIFEPELWDDLVL